MGVRRAMNIVLDAAHRKSGSICTLGPLIHNRHVVELLQSKGVRVIDDVSEVGDSTVVIRAHGIPPEVRAELERNGARVRDATCPHVRKVQSIVKKRAAEGYRILIVGDPGHAEVEGLLGYADGKGVVISSVSELDALGDMDKVCVVAQTTQNAQTFQEISREAARRYRDCIVFDTLCNSTHERQEEVRELAKQADAIVVVGGYNSANTNRLADIARATGVPTFHVESADELSDVAIDRFRNVAVTAGASTPNWLIQGVVEAIDRAQRRRSAALARAFVYGLRLFQDSGVHIAIGAALLTYASCLLQELSVLPEYLILAFSYVFAMQHLMYFTDRAAAMYNEPTRALFYERHKLLIISVGAAGVVTALAFSAMLGLDTFGLILLATAAGVAYNARIVPEKLVRFVRYRRPKDVPASRDIFAGLGWSVVTVAVPFLHASSSLAGRNVVAFFFVFAIAFIRSVIVDVKHIQGDRVVGNETIPIIIGKERTKVMLGALAALTAAVLVVAAQRGLVSSLGVYLLSCIIYACIYLYLYHERIIFQGISFEGVVDSNYWLAGIVALVWRLSQH